MDMCRGYGMAGSNATNPVIFEPMAMSILLFQQKTLRKLEKRLEEYWTVITRNLIPYF